MICSIITNRNENEDLDTQIDVFTESAAADNEEMEICGVDLQSHKEMFHAVYEKVWECEINYY